MTYELAKRLKDWRVVMLTKAYATIERVKNPKVSKMIRL